MVKGEGIGRRNLILKSCDFTILLPFQDSQEKEKGTPSKQCRLGTLKRPGRPLSHPQVRGQLQMRRMIPSPLHCLLKHFHPKKELFLSCDASPYGVGAVLSHMMEDVTERQVVTLLQTWVTYYFSCHCYYFGAATVQGWQLF